MAHPKRSQTTTSENSTKEEVQLRKPSTPGSRGAPPASPLLGNANNPNKADIPDRRKGATTGPSVSYSVKNVQQKYRYLQHQHSKRLEQVIWLLDHVWPSCLLRLCRITRRRQEWQEGTRMSAVTETTRIAFPSSQTGRRTGGICMFVVYEAAFLTNTYYVLAQGIFLSFGQFWVVKQLLTSL